MTPFHWIKIYKTLPRHPKLLKLLHKVSADRPSVIGHLALLWMWSTDYTRGGDLSQYSAAEIAAASEWNGDPDIWLRALKECGWIDEENCIHDWDEYFGDVIEVRKNDARRKRESRKRLQTGRPKDVTRTSAGHPETSHDVTPPSDVEERRGEEKRREERESTLASETCSNGDPNSPPTPTPRFAEIPTREEVVEHGNMAGVPPDFAVAWWARMTGEKKWLRRNGTLIPWMTWLATDWNEKKPSWKLQDRPRRTEAEVKALLDALSGLEGKEAERIALREELIAIRKA